MIRQQEDDLRIAEELGHKEAHEAKKPRIKRKIFSKPRPLGSER
jgi:hypothetical protein